MWVSLYRLLHYGNISPAVSPESYRQASSSSSSSYPVKRTLLSKRQRLQIMQQCIELLCQEPSMQISQIELINLDNFEVEGIGDDEDEQSESDDAYHKMERLNFKLDSRTLPRVRLRLSVSRSVLERAKNDEAEERPVPPAYIYAIGELASTGENVETKIAEIIQNVGKSRQQHLGVILWQQILYLHNWFPLWESLRENSQKMHKPQIKTMVFPMQLMSHHSSNNNSARVDVNSIDNSVLNTPSSMYNNASPSEKNSNDSEKMYEYAREVQDYVYQSCYEIDLLGETGVQGEKIRMGMSTTDIALWNQLVIGAYHLMGEDVHPEAKVPQRGLHRNDYSNYSIDEYNYEQDSVRSSITTTPENHSLIIPEYSTSRPSKVITNEQVQSILAAIHDAANNYLAAHQKKSSSGYYGSMWSDSRATGRIRVTAFRKKISDLFTGILNKNLGVATSSATQNLSPNEVVEEIRAILNDFFMSKIGKSRPGIMHDSFIAFLLEQLKKVPHAIAILGAEAEAGIKLDDKSDYTAQTPLMKVIREAWRHAFSRLPVLEFESENENTGTSLNIESP